VLIGFDEVTNLIIQPIWVREEYAMIVRIWDWFIPIIPPISAFKAAANRINVLIWGWIR